jgi:predicted ATPase
LPPLRVALSGASSTGKSTLARELSSRLGLPLIPEQARRVLADTNMTLQAVRRDRDTLLRFQQSVLEYQIRRETAFPQGFVADRAVYDILVLFIVYLDAPRETLRAFERKVFAHAAARPYTLNVLLRPEGFTVEDDGVRTPDARHQAYLDGHFHGLFRAWGIDVLSPRGSVSRRADAVVRRLEAAGFGPFPAPR